MGRLALLLVVTLRLPSRRRRESGSELELVLDLNHHLYAVNRRLRSEMAMVRRLRPCQSHRSVPVLAMVPRRVRLQPLCVGLGLGLGCRARLQPALAMEMGSVKASQ